MPRVALVLDVATSTVDAEVVAARLVLEEVAARFAAFGVSLCINFFVSALHV